MKATDLLDSHVISLFSEHFYEKEILEWQGKPRGGYTIMLLEMAGIQPFNATMPFGYNVGTSSPLTFLLLIGFFVGGFFYVSEDWFSLVLTIIVILSIIIIPDVLRYFRKKNTAYAFSDQRVFFKLWRYGKETIHSIHYKDIGRITYEEYPDGSGVLHFLPKKPFDFYTYDFFTGDRQHYPTFEMLENVMDVYHQVEKLRRARK